MSFSSNWEISLSDRIHEIVMCNRNGLHIMKQAYKIMFKCHLVLLIYHSLYNMEIDTSKFMEAKENRNKVFDEFKDIDEEKMNETIKNNDELKQYNKASNNCYLYALNTVNDYAYKEMRRLHKFQDEHGLNRDEMTNFVYEDLNKITNTNHIKFVNENIDILDY